MENVVTNVTTQNQLLCLDLYNFTIWSSIRMAQHCQCYFFWTRRPIHTEILNAQKSEGKCQATTLTTSVEFLCGNFQIERQQTSNGIY